MINASAEPEVRQAQAEKTRAAIYRISEAVHSTQNLAELFRSIHAIVGGLMPADNFYIALYDPTTGMLNFPYFRDQYDETPAPKPLGRGLTEYVLRTGSPLLALPAVFDELVQRGEVESLGAPSIDWLGVPLKTPDRIIGVLVVQTYTEGIRFGEDDKQVLVFVSEQVAMAIERKRMEDALRLSEQQYRTTVDSIGDIIHVVDADLRVALHNAAFQTWARRAGWNDEFIGRTIFEIFPFLSEQVRLEYQTVFQIGKVLLTEESNVVAGAEVSTETYKMPLHEAGRVARVVTVVRDVTERKRAEVALREAHDELERRVQERTAELAAVNAGLLKEINERQRMEAELLRARKLESLGVLAGGIAHDFNNILTGILGNITLARRYTADPRVVEVLARAERASLRARDLTHQLLTFSQGGAPVKKTASIAELLRDTALFILRGSDVKCQLSVAEDLWPAEIDVGQISQVFQNLLINADQAMPDGGIVEVHASNVALDAESSIPLPAGRYVLISVEDQGIGIPEPYRSRIFDPYFTTKQKGSGLGLATAYSIVKRHDGHITFESEVGVGTTFYIYLPASAGALPAPPAEPAAWQPRQGRVLLMDDEEIVREVADEMLQMLGYEVACASDGVEAITRYSEARAAGRPFDLVIMDLTIPGGLGGKETIRRLRALYPEVKALASSGYSNDPVMAQFQEYGFDGVIAKPYEMAELNEALRQALALRPSASAS